MNKKIVNVLGFGVMGAQISSLLLMMGYNVVVYTHKKEPAVKKSINQNFKLLERFGGHSLESVSSWSLVNDCSVLTPNLTIDCLPENLEIKRDVISKINYDFGNSGSCLITNTSSFCPEEVHPEAIGLHFFNPVAKFNFFELGSHNKLHDELYHLLSALEENGFHRVDVKNNRGYIANFFIFQEISSLFEMYEVHGQPVESIDTVLTLLGKGLSFRNCLSMIDVMGVDVTNRIFENLSSEYKIYHPVTLILAEKNGFLGKKNQKTVKSFFKCLGDYKK